MSLDHYVSLFSALISFAGLLLVLVQLRASARQQKLGSYVTMVDTNRALVCLGFSHPQLFSILGDSPNADPEWERYYLQLWLNQFFLTHAFLKHSSLMGEFKEILERDVTDFMAMKNMQRHWHKYGQFYTASFQKYVNAILKKNEPPPAAHVKRRK